MDDTSQKIVIRFGQAPGTFEAETLGFKGAKCEETMAKVLRDLGDQLSAKHTDDFYEDPDTQKEVTFE